MLRRHEVNDLLLCNRNSILNKTIGKNKTGNNNYYFDGVYFSAQGNAYTCDDTTYFDMDQLLNGGMLCILSARKRKAECTYSFIYRTNFTHEGI